ncbi:hypothetical protein CMEL01_10261 [Colletotrichum melonis]|uniref:Uncharacterized protein n=1 Tax=Colletotrichum melonis TaxID=1209925 RepID=A0AAI9XFY9_9PEZI|nr:hypothetical protein CMEL01_10261 [Colletotrichum melonis]
MYPRQQLIAEDCDDDPAPRQDTSPRSRLRQRFYGRGRYAARSKHRCCGFAASMSHRMTLGHAEPFCIKYRNNVCLQRSLTTIMQ